MEIKLLCACGTKFKFDVEPVHGRMPAPVYCPVCGADDTAQANDLLRDSGVEPAPRLVTATPVTTVPTPMPASPPPAAGGLRIHRAHAPGDSPGQSPPPPPPAPPPIRVTYEEPKSKTPWWTIAATVLVIAGVVLGGWKMAVKWYRGVKAVAEIASTISEISSGNVAPYQSNFDYLDSVVLFVRHTNHLEIGEACKTYWKEKLKKNLTIGGEGQMAQVGDYQLVPEHNGYVRIFGTLEWPATQYEAVSQHLSQQFKTLVFEVSESDFSGAFHFGVYEQGTRKFHAKTEFKRVDGDMEEFVRTEGNEWAIKNGYKPDPDLGFNAFYLDDADEITQRLGMKFWDEPEGVEIKGVLMHETP